MTYLIKKIKTKEEITGCEKFLVDHVQWVNGPCPFTYGYMGYLEGRGVYVQMICEEKNPRRHAVDPEGRTCKEKGSRVCDDSAMEIFIAFPEEDGSISNDSLYVNFEINANGVMYGAYGHGRKNREFLPEKIYQAAAPKAEIGENSWNLEVLFPEEFLREISGKDLSISGTKVFCNFYKISETPEIEHYASWNRIQSETPNFHLPASFGAAVVE